MKTGFHSWRSLRYWADNLVGATIRLLVVCRGWLLLQPDKQPLLRLVFPHVHKHRGFVFREVVETGIEDDVFLGPSCVFTNVVNPRSQINRKSEYQTTVVHRGATIGANATIICGATIGRYAFIGAGAVVRGDVPDYALMLGVPARQKGWMSRHGHRLPAPDSQGVMCCPESGWRYAEEAGILHCLDRAENLPLQSI